MKKIVITGGPCSGKTSVIEELTKRGYPTLDETAKLVILLRNRFSHTADEPKIRQHLIFKKQYTKEKRAFKEDYGLIFLDRSLIDGLGYSLLYQGEDSLKKYWDVVSYRNYDRVFSLDLLPFDSEGWRLENENEEEAKKINNSILEVYKRLDYSPISVPVMPVKERVEFILKKV